MIRARSRASVFPRGCTTTEATPGLVWNTAATFAWVWTTLGSGYWAPSKACGCRTPARSSSRVSACEIRLDTGRLGLLAPVSGRVIATNERLLEQPGLVNESPYTNGWLLMVKPFDLPSELVNLLYGGRARRWIEQEIGRVREKVNGNGRQGNIHELEKDATWREDIIDEIAGEFLLAKLKQVA